MGRAARRDCSHPTDVVTSAAMQLEQEHRHEAPGRRVFLPHCLLALDPASQDLAVAAGEGL